MTASPGFRVLGLDLASNVGWAVMDSNQQLIDSGETIVKNGPTDSTPTACRALKVKLTELHAQHKFNAVIAEAIAPGMARHTQVARILFGLNVAAEAWCETNGLDFLRPLPAPTVKKHAANLLGHPKSVRGKEQTIEASTVILGRPPQSDDEADAVIVAHWAVSNAVELEEPA